MILILALMPEVLKTFASHQDIHENATISRYFKAFVPLVALLILALALGFILAAA